MTLAIDITDGHGLSNKAHRELLLKKSKVMMLYYPFISHLTSCTLLKTEHFSFKCGHDVQVSKLIKEDWPIVLCRNYYVLVNTKVLEYKGDLCMHCYVFLSDEYSLT